MKKMILALALTWTSSALAQPLPPVIDCYQNATQSEDISNYMSCFSDDAIMIDVSRTITGNDAIKRWAENEVIPYGKTFSHRKILEQDSNYAKTEVKWSSWIAHYHYWWDENNKITRMSLQYAD